MTIPNQQQGVVMSSLFQELPAEVKLQIVEKLIEDAYAAAAAEPHYWTLDGCEDAIHQVYITNDPTEDLASQTRRFQRIRLVSQINSTTRDLVNRRLPRFPRDHHFADHLRVTTSGYKIKQLSYTWVCPGYDTFHLELATRRYKDDGDNTKPLGNAIMNATGKSLEDLEHVQRVWHYQERLISASESEIQILAALPKLKFISLWGCHIARPERPTEPHSHNELQPVDPEIFPHLAPKVNENPKRLVTLWQPLWKAGVRITFGRRWMEGNENVELVGTDEGLRLRFLLKECNCYKDLQGDNEKLEEDNQPEGLEHEGNESKGTKPDEQ